jgi:hypothetical protein
MASIEEWNQLQKKDRFFYEAFDEEAAAKEAGDLKTSNPRGSAGPRSGIHISNHKSDYQKDVNLALYIPGKRDGEQSEDLALIVLHVQFAAHGEGRFKEAKVDFSFTELNKGDSPPEVVSWAPFRFQQRFETSESEKSKETNVNGSLTAGDGQHASATLQLGRRWEENFKQQYFAKAWTKQRYRDELGKTYGIEWNFDENMSQKHGVPPDTHLAMLIRPSKDASGKATKFQGWLELSVKAGSVEDFLRRIAKPFSGKLPDAPVNFPPDSGLWTNDILEELGKGLDKNKLGKYRGNGMLSLIGQIQAEQQAGRKAVNP